MYYYNDMPFESKSVAEQTFGSIKMCHLGRERFGTSPDGSDLRLRRYVFLSADLSKLNNITNAADGSEAYAADTSKLYVLCSNRWIEWSGSSDGTGVTLKWIHAE